jgi:hypothetical protein
MQHLGVAATILLIVIILGCVVIVMRHPSHNRRTPPEQRPRKPVGHLQFGAMSGQSHSLGAVSRLASSVNGRDWRITWDPATKLDPNAIPTNTYMVDVVGPRPYKVSSLYNQKVTGTHYDVPQYLFEGEYDVTVWPYDAKYGKGLPKSGRFKNV